MQTPKTRNGSSDVPQRTSPATPRSARVSKTGGNESDTSGITPMKTMTERSPKVVERRSPRSPATEKKRPSRISELESQVNQLQEDLKKAKDQLSSAETWKRKALQEAEEGKKQLLDASLKLEDSQKQLLDFSAAEESRLQELRKISQERDRAWQSELEAVQNQHSVDSAALGSAMAEIQKLKLQLEASSQSEADTMKQSEEAHLKLKAFEQEMEEKLAIIESLNVQLKDGKKAESEAKAMVSESQELLGKAKITIEDLRDEGSKLREALRLKEAELDEFKDQVKSLEHIATNSQSGHLESEIEKLRSTLEAAEIKHREEQTQNATKIETAFNTVESLKIELKKREEEVAELKATLNEKEIALQWLVDSNKEENSEEIERTRMNQMQSELEAKLIKSVSDIAELKANLMDKENELQSISEENETLKVGKAKQEAESHKQYETAIAELELAKAAEQEVRMKLGYVTEEADKNSRRAARVAEQLETAQAANSEMESELRRLRVQSDQWRKAAEAAAAALTTNNGRFMERSGSMDSDYNSIGGKLMSSPFSDLDDESPKKKNNNVLRRMSGLWKKSPK
ncbi:interactor of constitutive active ROPs 2, chloroplastic-like isoform X2 [Ananas comosus]|nr:interactor of constitutive active ROPs 2, chloroplastic-like isoform X2 [Ananas comosus]